MDKTIFPMHFVLKGEVGGEETANQPNLQDTASVKFYLT